MFDFLKGQIAQSMGRQLLTYIAGILGTYGVLDKSGEALFVATALGLATLVMSVVSALTKKRAMQVEAAVAKAPNLTAIKTSSKTDPVFIQVTRAANPQ